MRATLKAENLKNNPTWTLADLLSPHLLNRKLIEIQ